MDNRYYVKVHPNRLITRAKKAGITSSTKEKWANSVPLTEDQSDPRHAKVLLASGEMTSDDNDLAIRIPWFSQLDWSPKKKTEGKEQEKPEASTIYVLAKIVSKPGRPDIVVITSNSAARNFGLIYTVRI